MVARHQESGIEWTANVSMENSPDMVRLGQYVFSLLPPSSTEDLLPKNVPSSLGAGHFTSVGTYVYRWRCVELPLPAKEFTVTVSPFLFYFQYHSQDLFALAPLFVCSCIIYRSSFNSRLYSGTMIE